MDTKIIFEVASAILLSLGAGGAIVLALSSWLGKIWAERLMAKETAKHNHELEQLRSSLQIQADQSAQTYKQKIDLYKEVGAPLIELLVKTQNIGSITVENRQAFERNRLNTTALLAMFAPAAVFDEYNRIIDYIYNCAEGKDTWSFAAFRDRALKFLSLIRADIGLYNDSLSYNGPR
ncbi:MAG: hypothetical protein Q8R67_26870 [Rhodoferax sp.]|nr:hypothetical protein [Rhodoferax sp.]MDP3655298.1 hypothetical protein [Rhodoferax sp.]